MRLRAAVVLAVMTVQLGVPSYVLLTQERPARFGWHMFAALRPGPTATAEFPSGTEEVDLTPYIPRPRPEVDYLRVLPGHLCEQLVDAISVTVTRGEDSATRRCDP